MGAAASVYGYTKYSPVYAVLLHESFAKMRRIIGIYMYRYYVFIVHIYIMHIYIYIMYAV